MEMKTNISKLKPYHISIAYDNRMKTLREHEKRELVEEIIQERDEEILKDVDVRIKIHEKSFDRYNKECIQARSDKDKSQLEYSENQAIKEMNIIDELKEIKQLLKGDKK